MKSPNFFIIGAPKCGTTSLASWLSEHPQIFMSPRKEPNFFNTDDKPSSFSTEKLYNGLFKNANHQHVAVGEASVYYLSSQDAVNNIEKYTSDAKYIVCLRSPIEMAVSWHDQVLFSGFENESDFMKAWELQEERRVEPPNPALIPTLCRDPRKLQYGKMCSLAEQVERLYTRIPKERVLLLFLDDVRYDTSVAFSAVQKFLGVDDMGRTDFPIKNPAKVPRSQILQKILELCIHLKLILGIKKSFGTLAPIKIFNSKYRSRPALPKSTILMLEDYFRADIKKMEHLTGRDLSHWLSACEDKDRIN